MMKLYVKTGCPYCFRVLTVLQASHVPYEERDIADSAVAEELISLGEKRQVPFLVDGSVSMYESEDIIDYIEGKYHVEHSGGVGGSPAKSSGVCPVE